jgi:hypothetical protein
LRSTPITVDGAIHCSQSIISIVIIVVRQLQREDPKRKYRNDSQLEKPAENQHDHRTYMQSADR